MSSYWWCPNCKAEIDSHCVTFEEFHDSCGHPAEWITPEEDGLLTQLRAELAAANGRVEELEAQILLERCPQCESRPIKPIRH